MPQHLAKKVLPYSAVQLFDIIIDVEEYPKFLPWCVATRILDREEDMFLAEMVLGYKNFTESYISKVGYLYPTKGEGHIRVNLVEGPFKYLENYWQLKQLNERETETEFYINFAFKSYLMEKMISTFFNNAFKKMVEAFENRAKFIHGSK